MTELAAAEIQPEPINCAPLGLDRTIGGWPWPTDTKPEAWNQLARVSIANCSADRQRAVESEQLLLFGWLNGEALPEIASRERVKREFLVWSVGPDDASLSVFRPAQLDLRNGSQ